MAMRCGFLPLLLVATSFLSGCATGKDGPSLETVGPSTDQPLVANSTNGTLVVYSAYEVNADFAAIVEVPFIPTTKITAALIPQTGQGRLLPTL
jgi:hypothetical protein